MDTQALEERFPEADDEILSEAVSRYGPPLLR